MQEPRRPRRLYDGFRSARRVALFASLVCFWGCPKETSPSPAKAPGPEKPTVWRFHGAVQAVRAQPPEHPDALTRGESELIVNVLREDRDVSGETWLELIAGQGPTDQAPAATARGGEPLHAPPGEYRLVVRHQVGALATARGLVEAVTLGPAERVRLLLELNAPLGRLVVRPLVSGQPAVGASVLITPTPADGEGRMKDASWPRNAVAGETHQLAPGTYSVTVTWMDASGQTHEQTRPVTIEEGKRSTVEVAFSGARPVTFVVRADGTRADITDACDVVIPDVGFDGPAGGLTGLAAGRHAATVTCRSDPAYEITMSTVLVVPGGVRKAVKSAAPNAETASTPLTATVPWAPAILVLQTADDDDTCDVRLSGPRSVLGAVNDELALPAGTWSATVTCAGRREVLEDLVLTPGGRHVHRVR